MTIHRLFLRIKKLAPQVETLELANEPIQVEVNNAHVDVARRSDHCRCAMATACMYTMNIDAAFFQRTTCVLVKGTKATEYKLTESISREIERFDRSGEFRPGIYTLKAMPPTYKLGHAHAPATKNSGPRISTYKLRTLDGVRTRLW